MSNSKNLSGLSASEIGWKFLFNPFLEASDKKIGRYLENGLLVDTCFADDTGFYETAIENPSYNDGVMIIVEEYDSSESALEGHNKWLELMLGELPDSLTDCHSDEIFLKE